MSRQKQKKKPHNSESGAPKAFDGAVVRSSPIQTGNMKTVLFVAVILALTAITYSSSFQNGFTNWDDDQNVYENKYIPEITLDNLKVYFTKPLVAMYTPLVYLSYAVDYQISQLNPTVYHATNLLLHLINVVLVFIAVKLLIGRMEAATIVSLIFAVHPVNVAAVTPVSVRSSLLYSMFFLGALILYIRYVKEGKYDGKYLIGAGIAFFLSLLSKSAAVVFPLLMLLTDYYYDRKMDRKAIVEKAPFFVLSLVFGILTVIFREDARHLGSSHSFALAERVFLTSYSVLFYIVKLLFPVNLSAYYPYPEKAGMFLPIEYYLALPALLIMAWALFRVRKHRKLIVFGSLFYLINIALVLKVIPIGNEMVCDRYAYLPLVGLLTAGVAICYKEKDDRLQGMPNIVRAAGLLLAGYVVLLSWMSFSRNPVWKDNFTLYEDILKKHQNVPTAYNGRAIAYWEHKAYKEALADLDRAISIEGSAEYYSNRGNVKKSIGDYAGALVDFDKAIALISRFAIERSNRGKGTLDSDSAFRLAAAYNSRGELQKTVKDYDAALLDYSKAMEADPAYSVSYYGRASVHVIKQDFDAALKDYSRAIELDPYRGGSVYYRRAYVYLLREDFAAALKDYDKVIELEPGHIDALNNRGYIRHLMKDDKGALEDYTRVIQRAPAHQDAFHNRGLIKWLLNDRVGACSDWKTAAQLGRKDSREMLAVNCKQ